ncbi:ATP-binding protein [Streptomyces sp. NBC_01244]|uniref:ATP-binding protein n=1 Tax=Streptomyces sp. NBC_01244 TaxID=2903797 RepID=UPI002E0F903C|nr:ATP-binding protein [Streptomyces sp. NBC_01244]
MTTAAVRTRPCVVGASGPDLTLSTDHVAGISTMRRRLIETLGVCGCAELMVDTAALLATELLSNALTHADVGGEPFRVRMDVYWSACGLTIVVTDPDPRLPVATSADDDAEHGRGLELLQALATRWGACPVAAGKTVWCHIA